MTPINHHSRRGTLSYSKCLGKIPGEYTIDLKPDAQTFAISAPRNVAIPLLPTVKQELQRMEDLKVIQKIEKSTDWCAAMVIAPKPKARFGDESAIPGRKAVRICVELRKLNESVQRQLKLLSVEQTLVQLASTKIFTKLDANSAFWQIQLSPASAELTTFITHLADSVSIDYPFGITSAPEY